MRSRNNLGHHHRSHIPTVSDTCEPACGELEEANARCRFGPLPWWQSRSAGLEELLGFARPHPRILRAQRGCYLDAESIEQRCRARARVLLESVFSHRRSWPGRTEGECPKTVELFP